MLVPLWATRPPPLLEETIPTPGAEKATLVLENGATFSLPSVSCCNAPTETMFSAEAGLEALMRNGLAAFIWLSLPEAAMARSYAAGPRSSSTAEGSSTTTRYESPNLRHLETRPCVSN